MADATQFHKGKFALVILALGILYQIISRFCGGPTPESLLQGCRPSHRLGEHGQVFGQRRIIKVTDTVHMATGYALGNSILIQAPRGAIVVDTTENLDAARDIAAAFRNITKAPIKAIFLTHHHPDHIFGTKGFLEHTDEYPQIWAHELFTVEQDRTADTSTAFFTRAMRQFGPLLPEEITTGFMLKFGTKTKELGSVEPTHFLREDEMDIEIAGLPMRLLHIPGETIDHMGIWLPSQKVFLCGDNIYQSFPNLYALRGTRSRDTMVWVRSLDKMRKLKPKILVPSHTFPVLGEQKISKLLTDYRDAIQFLHDQTVRYINRGVHPDDIVPLVNLPAQLKTNPYLEETYGTVRWSVKGIYSSYLGWFSGSVADIENMSTKEKAQRMIQLAGGVGSLASAAQQALDKGDYNWALELASHIFRLNPEHAHARQIRLDSIKALAAQQTSVIGRNYFLTTALEDHNLVENKVPQVLKAESVYKMPLKRIFRSMALKLKAEEVEGQHKLVVFNFTDVEKVFSLVLRNSILDIQEDWAPENYDIMVTMESVTWRKLIMGEISPLTAYLKGEVVIEGGVLAFRQFMNYIEN